MDDLIESLGSLNNHCPYDEYENLIAYIHICETATRENAEVVAKEIYGPIKTYTEKIDLNPENFVGTKEYESIVKIRKLLDRYWETLQSKPLDHVEQIYCALAFFRSINEYISQLA